MMKTSVKEIKNQIQQIVGDNYTVKTNFSYSDFLVEIYPYVISAYICYDDANVWYEFGLNLSFIPTNQEYLNNNDMIMLNKVIDILKENRNFVLKRFKKWKIEEYKEYLKEKEEENKHTLEVFKQTITQMMIGK